MAESSISSPSSTLTRQQFFDRIEEARPAVAVFDCDGTLWAGDAGVGFMRWSMESGLLSRDASTWMDTRYAAYLRGEVSELTICGEMVQIYRGLRDADLRDAARVFFEKAVRPHIFPEMMDLCVRLQSKNVDLWAVSSTNQWVIADAVQQFGISTERVLAARVRVEDGIVTDKLIDVPTDEGKAESLARAGLPHPDAIFGNSIHDAAMLEIAGHPFVVNPTAALSELAMTRGWPIFQPAVRHA